ncbi:YqaE/Pmp3 family membrane protein [Halomonas sp. 18H]|uniref:YqaE/Pmp3 family membrane protein n=1 Tax=Halomonas almeriensis TaxID=308163 RepID=UPI0022305899|nr:MULTISPECIES: YqaE/Pmp3 family membrane protein [Halomonas]MCW4151546.1 YqaE/Pmp3 family membrane protein [Halomonas sp. 18H]MDN3552683.1 YqaE/Pmp3 family membrane protein [Halomonas almeriensis]
MDAREYLARKGLDGERDKERPNTLEEKAWSRARESADHRPRSGTPHDWEDWERYHQTLAEGAEAIEQKIDHQAHRPPEDATPDAASGGVEHFIPGKTPDATDTADAVWQADAAADAAQAQAESYARRSAPRQAAPSRPEPYAAIIMLAVLMPPLAMALGGAGGRRILVSLGLTLLFWIPGALDAVLWLRRR